MIKYKNTVEAWMARIEDALEFRRRYGIEDRWAILESMYMNIKGSGAEFGPNIIQEMGDALIAGLGVNAPAIGISPSVIDPRSVETYRVVNAVDSWLMEELLIPEIGQDVALHAYLWGRGIVKVGYDSEWGFDEAFDLGTVANPWGMTLTQFSKKGHRLEYGFGRPGMPWVAPVLPQDFIVPWGTRRLEWCPWVAHRIYRHVDLLKSDVKYEKTKDLQPTLSMKDITNQYLKVGSKRKQINRTWLPTISRDRSNDAEFVELFEITNIVTGGLITLSEQAIHRVVKDDNMQIDGLPYISLSLLRHPRSFWGTPPAEYLRYHQAEQYDIALQASKQRRINVQKYLFREGSMKIEEMNKALSAEVGIAAMMKQNSRPKEDIILMPQGNNLLLWQDAEHARRNSRESLGFSRNQLGEFDSSSRRTASEAQLVAQGSNRRMDRRQAAVAIFYQDLFKKLNQTIFTFWKTPRLIQLNIDDWPSFTGEEIRAEYSYKTTFSQERNLDPATRRQEAFQAYMTLSQDPFVDQLELRRYLSRVFADVEFDRLFTDRPQIPPGTAPPGTAPPGQQPQGGQK